MKRALVVENGSIGRRHTRILSEMLQFDEIVIKKATDPYLAMH